MTNASEYAASLAATLDEIWTAADNGEEYEGQDALEYLEEMPLEITRRTGHPFEVLMTYGGPTATIQAHLTDDGWVEPYSTVLVVHWGSDEDVVRGGGIDRTAEHFAELTTEG